MLRDSAAYSFSRIATTALPIRVCKSAEVPKIINITVDYLRPAGLTETHARALITKQGRRIANVSCKAWQDNESRLIARPGANLPRNIPAMMHRNTHRVRYFSNIDSFLSIVINLS